MSEGFDKEAERERLRKKYEDDRADREATERMSELLLQGATMTNKHCNQCGTPIFRYQDQEFCPSCQREVRDSEDAAGSESDEAQAAQAEGDASESTDDTNERQEATHHTAGQHQSTSATTGTDQAVEPGGKQEQSGAASDVDRTGTVSTAEPSVDRSLDLDGEPSLDDATRTLVETITILSRRAARAEDPRRAKDLLAAAREAAETLDTLRGGS